MVLAVLVAVLFVTRERWLVALGEYLVESNPPVSADVAVVLGGGASGDRILTACRLAAEGLTTKILVSGPQGPYGTNEADLEIAFAVKHGCSPKVLVPARHKAHSTYEEAESLLPLIRGMNAKKVLLITSNYHTRRAARVFRAQGPDLRIVAVAAPDEFFRPDAWWKNREARKIVYMEWSKTIAEWLGI